MGTVKVEFEPYPPYSAEDICERLAELVREMELEGWYRWGLIMELPMDEKSWEFCKRMRTYCGVCIFSNE